MFDALRTHPVKVSASPLLLSERTESIISHNIPICWRIWLELPKDGSHWHEFRGQSQSRVRAIGTWSLSLGNLSMALDEDGRRPWSKASPESELPKNYVRLIPQSCILFNTSSSSLFPKRANLTMESYNPSFLSYRIDTHHIFSASWVSNCVSHLLSTSWLYGIAERIRFWWKMKEFRALLLDSVDLAKSRSSNSW